MILTTIKDTFTVAIGVSGQDLRSKLSITISLALSVDYVVLLNMEAYIENLEI